MQKIWNLSYFSFPLNLKNLISGPICDLFAPKIPEKDFCWNNFTKILVFILL